VNRSGAALFIWIVLGATAFSVQSADLSWAGEYADKNFLKGQAVFELSVSQSRNAIKIAFDAAYSDGHGAAPDGEGQANITGKNTLQFNWKDSFENSGIGTIKREGKDVIVSMKTTHVIDSRSLMFYGENMRLKRVNK
jgi:hypothetical protein